MTRKISQLDTKFTVNLCKGRGRRVRESNLICINALLNKLKIPGTTPTPPPPPLAKINIRGRRKDLGEEA